MTCVVVKFTMEGFHRWEAAPKHRDYLRPKHRHLFHVRVDLEVRHHDREIEVHDLRDYCRRKFAGGDFGMLSCEQLAYGLAASLTTKYGQRFVSVEVLEDGEVGGRVSGRGF